MMEQQARVAMNQNNDKETKDEIEAFSKAALEMSKITDHGGENRG